MSTSDPITVIQTLPALDAGGVERGTLEIAKALVDRGHHSIVVSAGGRMVRELTKTGSEHVTMPIGKKSPFTVGCIYKLRKLLPKNGNTILHSRSRLPAWVSYLAWKGLDPHNRPHFVTSVHGPYSVNRYSKIMTSGEKVIAISNFIKSYITENYPAVDINKIVTIPRGVSTKEFPFGYHASDEWQTRWQIDFPEIQGRYLITLPARLTRWKGHEDFLHLIKLFDKVNNIHGLIVGGPHPGKEHYYHELKEKVHQLGLREKISFTGHRNDMREIMSISGVVLSLSKEPEAFGRTALEALSLGVPVIGYEHGGVGEVLQSIFPAGLVPIGDIDGVARLIAAFIKNKPFVTKQHPYTLKQMQNKTIDLYESLTVM